MTLTISKSFFSRADKKLLEQIKEFAAYQKGRIDLEHVLDAENKLYVGRLHMNIADRKQYSTSMTYTGTLDFLRYRKTTGEEEHTTINHQGNEIPVIEEIALHERTELCSLNNRYEQRGATISTYSIDRNFQKMLFDEHSTKVPIAFIEQLHTPLRDQLQAIMQAYIDTRNL